MSIIVAACGLLSAVLGVCCGVFYIRSIISGETRPHQLSLTIFAVMNGIVTLSQLWEGGGWSVMLSATYFVTSVIGMVLSFRYGVRDTSVHDRWLFVLTLATIVVWVLTRSNATAIWLTVLIDVAATLMIVLKLRVAPDSEALFPWVTALAAYVFSCLSLMGTAPGVLYVRPVYGLVSDIVVVSTIVWVTRRVRADAVETSPSREEHRTAVGELT